MRNILYTPLFAYGKSATTHDIAKAVAIILMVIDHVGYYFLPESWILRSVGRGAAPIFLFLVGFTAKAEIDKVLLGYAVALSIAQVALGVGLLPLNILWSILLLRILIAVLAKKLDIFSNLGMLWVGMVIWMVPLSFLFEYGGGGLLIALAGYAIRHKTKETHAKVLRFTGASLFVYFLYMFAMMQDKTAGQAELIACGALLTLVPALLYLAFRNYRLHPVNIKSGALNTATMFISRNSLQFYFWHVVAFAAIKAALCIEECQLWKVF